jgi:hypothetical protein
MAHANPLLGTWKLKSCVVTTARGARSTPYGENPTGYLSYSADGRMQVIGAAQRRTIASAGPAPSERERAALHDTMFAYAGRYSLEADKVIHHVEISWNQAWTGTEQVRLFEIDGNLLTLTTRFAEPDDGTETEYAVTWERATGAR